jgi:copper chaperone NosL
MNIVDQQHAAEIVTKKGKVYVYDAIECMLNDKGNNNSETVAMFLVMDYNSPNTFLEAEQSYYLISENIPSPMGAFLSAFNSGSTATKLQEEKGGTVYDWEEILKEF